MRKKLLSIPILMLFVLSVLSVNMMGVSAVEPATIYIEPASIVSSDYIVGTLFTVAIKTDYMGTDPDLDYITAYQFTLYYDPNILKGVEVVNGDLIVGGSAEFRAGTFDEIAGKLSLTVGFYAEEEVTPGPGTLANVTFKPVGVGPSAITIGPETKLIGWDAWAGKEYYIPIQLQHGFFDNTGAIEAYMPVAVITASAAEYVNESATFDGKGSYDPDGTVIISYKWKFGDGTTTTTDAKTIHHTYTTIGIYTVTLVVTDAQNQVSDPAYHTITIVERPVVDLCEREAWPEHRRHDISSHGAINTLYAQVNNTGSETLLTKVRFTIYTGKVGEELGTVETSPVWVASLETVVLTAELDVTKLGTGKFYAKAQCFYWVGKWFAGVNIKAFSFTVVP